MTVITKTLPKANTRHSYAALRNNERTEAAWAVYGKVGMASDGKHNSQQRTQHAAAWFLELVSGKSEAVITPIVVMTFWLS